MAERLPYYAQFDGDEINGKRYALGDEVERSVDAGTIAYLAGIGRIAVTKPSAIVVVPPSGKALDDMDRAELEATARSMVDLSRYDDDALRAEIDRRRNDQAEADEDDDKGDEGALTPPAGTAPQGDGTVAGSLAAAGTGANPETYADLKDMPLGTMTTAQLHTVADSEDVTFGEDVKTDEDRIAAIERQRNAA